MNKNSILIAGFALSSSLVSGTVLFQDNFNAPDINNLDQSDQTGRRSGLVPGIQVRSSRIQHGIVSNQLNFLNNRTGRIRFHDDSDNDTGTAGIWYDWASGITGSTILGTQNLRIAFDWNVTDNSSDNWVSVNFGISGPGVPEPGFRVNHPETDIGMLLRFNGDTQLFDNGAGLGAQGSFSPTTGTRRVTFDYTLDSFADGTNVGLIANVDGTEVYNGNPFTLDNNGGELYFEIGNLQNTLLDNVTISSVPEPSVVLMSLLGLAGLVRRRRSN
jgi:hypothetical protein